MIKMLRVVLVCVLVFFMGTYAVTSGYLQISLSESIGGIVVASLLLLLSGFSYWLGKRDASPKDKGDGEED